MLGAIIGDMVGSVYEFDNIKTPDFQPLFDVEADYTDDSIMSVAVGDWLVNTDRSRASLEERLVFWANKYPCPMGGYGATFENWLFHPENLFEFRDGQHPDDIYTTARRPYNSWGNGSAMRASACGWVAHTLDEAFDLGKRSAEVTHNHPEGIRGAQAVAAAVFMARHGESKAAIRQYLEDQFDYNLHLSCNDIRPSYDWDSSCQGTVPPAIIAFLDSHSFEEAIRLAVSLGGDSDTIACITGGIAEAYYRLQPNSNEVGITPAILAETMRRLPEEMQTIVRQVQNES